MVVKNENTNHLKLMQGDVETTLYNHMSQINFAICLLFASQVPVYCHERRRLRVGINFIIKTCDTRKRKVPLSTVLATEILQAYNNEVSVLIQEFLIPVC